MSDKRIEGRVVSYCDIPEELVAGTWLEEYQPGCYIECHIDEEEEMNELDNWLISNYPGIEKETFFIEIDY